MWVSAIRRTDRQLGQQSRDANRRQGLQLQGQARHGGWAGDLGDKPQGQLAKRVNFRIYSTISKKCIPHRMISNLLVTVVAVCGADKNDRFSGSVGQMHAVLESFF